MTFIHPSARRTRLALVLLTSVGVMEIALHRLIPQLDGRRIERQSLMALHGSYAHLYLSQFKGQAT